MRLSRRDGRLVILAALAVYFSILVIGWAATGSAPWRALGVEPASPSFVDARAVTAGWECTRRGYDVLPGNPCEPSLPPPFYPRLWMRIAFLGLGQGSTAYLAIGMAAVFFASVWALLGPLTVRAGLLTAAVLVSPSVMLGVERGNVDLAVFAIVALFLLLFRLRAPIARALAHGVVLLAAMLKLYPAFAFLVALQQRRREALAGFAFLAVAFGVYALLTLDDLRTISRVATRGTTSSYGLEIVPEVSLPWLAGKTGVEWLGSDTAELLGELLWGLAALLAACWLVRGRHKTPANTGDPAPLAMFWAGASIYAGTYVVLGANYDYRLAFLVLTLPQLLQWTRQARPAVPWARWALAGLVVTCWLSELLFPKALGLREAWTRVSLAFPPEEAINWLLLVYFLAALWLTLPQLAGASLGSWRKR